MGSIQNLRGLGNPDVDDSVRLMFGYCLTAFVLIRGLDLLLNISSLSTCIT
jgi:hypothetical protein